MPTTSIVFLLIFFLFFAAEKMVVEKDEHRFCSEKRFFGRSLAGRRQGKSHTPGERREEEEESTIRFLIYAEHTRSDEQHSILFSFI